MKEVKRGPVCLEAGEMGAPAPSFPEQQSPASSREGPAVSREGTKNQEGDTVSSADRPSFLPRDPT